MGHTPRRMVLLGAAAAAVLGMLAWAMVPANPPSSAPAGNSSAATPATTAAAMPNPIATANRPAIVKVTRPGATRSLSPATASLQITVRPEAVERGEPYLVNVYAVPSETAGASTGKGEDTFVGSFSFFPPPRAGETRTFTVPAPPGAVGGGGDLTLKVEIVPAAPDAKLDKSTLAVVDAKIGAE